MAQMIPGKKRMRMLWLIVALAGAGIAVFTLWHLTWQIGYGLPGNVNFYLRQGKYRSIVARARSISLSPGDRTTTNLEGLRVDVGRNPAGSYTVTITTVDWHHAGTYGYVFSDEPLTPHPNVNYPDLRTVDNPGNMPFADNSIAGQGDQWWCVYNNLL